MNFPPRSSDRRGLLVVRRDDAGAFVYVPRRPAGERPVPVRSLRADVDRLSGQELLEVLMYRGTPSIVDVVGLIKHAFAERRLRAGLWDSV